MHRQRYELHSSNGQRKPHNEQGDAAASANKRHLYRSSKDIKNGEVDLCKISTRITSVSSQAKRARNRLEKGKSQGASMNSIAEAELEKTKNVFRVSKQDIPDMMDETPPKGDKER